MPVTCAFADPIRDRIRPGGRLVAGIVAVMLMMACAGPDDPVTKQLFSDARNAVPSTASMSSAITIDDTSVPVTGGFNTSQVFLGFPVHLSGSTVRATITRTASRIVLSLGSRSGQLYPPPKLGTSGRTTTGLLSQTTTGKFDPLNYDQMQEVTYYEDDRVDNIPTYHLHAKYSPLLEVKRGEFDPLPEEDLWIARNTHYPVKVDADSMTLTISHWNQPIQRTASSEVSSILTASISERRYSSSATVHCTSNDDFQAFGSYPDFGFMFSDRCLNDLSFRKSIGADLLSALVLLNPDVGLPVAVISIIADVYIQWLLYVDTQQCHNNGADLHIKFYAGVLPIPTVEKRSAFYC